VPFAKRAFIQIPLLKSSAGSGHQGHWIAWIKLPREIAPSHWPDAHGHWHTAAAHWKMTIANTHAGLAQWTAAGEAATSKRIGATAASRKSIISAKNPTGPARPN
jgi:hypothetical protein